MRKWIWGVLCLLVLSLGGAFAALQLGALKLITVDLKTMKASPNRMTWVDGGRDDKQGRCLSSAFEMPGQSWSQGLSAGGISVLQNNLTGSVDPRSRGKALAPFLKLGQKNDVWVLVVDHFSPVRISLKETGTLRSYGLSHGSLVLDHLRAVLVGAGFAAQSSGMEYTLGMSRVRLLKIEVGALTPQQTGAVHTSVVMQRIQNTLRRNKIGEKSNIVVNMSLALIPCELQQNYLEIKSSLSQTLLYTFNRYLHDLYLVNSPPVTEQAFITGLLNPAVSASEPLHQFVTTLHSTFPKAVVVASSGNYGLQISTMPAAWDEVVGVGASDSKGKPAVIDGLIWPDVGDVTEVGQWLHLQSADASVGCSPASRENCVFQPTPTAPDVPDLKTLSYRGTSFSAPTVTAYIAMAMLAPEPRCVPPAAALPASLFLPAVPKLGNGWLPPLLQASGCP